MESLEPRDRQNAVGPSSQPLKNKSNGSNHTSDNESPPHNISTEETQNSNDSANDLEATESDADYKSENESNHINNAAQMHETVWSSIGLKNPSKGGKIPRGLTTGLTHTPKKSRRSNKRYDLRRSPTKYVLHNEIPSRLKKNSPLLWKMNLLIIHWNSVSN